MHNTNSNGNHSDEYDIQYDDSTSDDNMPQPTDKPWSPFGIKQSKSHQHAVKLARDLICEITENEKKLMWRARDQLVSMPSALPIFLKCVNWRDLSCRAETYQYLREWQPPTYLEDALELLGPQFIDTRVREYGVMCIANMHDSDLQRYLLQLVQCLKFELHHNNAL
eukprot:42554_1